jgi:hypothetical protein
MPSTYENIWGSVVKLCQSMIVDMTTVGQITPQFIDWEAHANIHELPNIDLLGPAHLAFEEESPHVIRANITIGVSAYNDANLFRHRRLAGLVFDRCRIGATFPYFKADETNTKPSFFKVLDGVTIPPMTRSEVRPLTFIQFEALLAPPTSDSVVTG